MNASLKTTTIIDIISGIDPQMTGGEATRLIHSFIDFLCEDSVWVENNMTDNDKKRLLQLCQSMGLK